MEIIQAGKATLTRCTIGGIEMFDDIGETIFHVKELRIYEDICKPYFTADLVIETNLNNYERFLYPTAEVNLAFVCPRSDGGRTRDPYRERFRVFSYKSESIGSGADGRLEHSLSLIGQEYYNDKHNVVTQNFNDRTGTSIASAIHQKYMASSGGLSIEPESLGLFGTQDKKVQVINKKPMKAIHDVLDRCVYSQYKSCAPVYFKNYEGYRMAPLQHILENGPVKQNFRHIPAQGKTALDVLLGYDLVYDFKPVAPAGESSGGVRAGEISGLQKGSSFFDFNTKNIIHKLPKRLTGQFPNTKYAEDMLNEAYKGGMGGLNLFHIIDEMVQKRSVDKHGPGGYNVTQEAFLSALNYAPKYWVSVPGQTGINITCGDRISVTYPVPPDIKTRTLFIPRLIHEIKFTEGPDRKPVTINARTEIYGVYWK